nr:MAG TPA: Protein of unknown function (DUF2492) [Caudoviricetes sp.]
MPSISLSCSAKLVYICSLFGKEKAFYTCSVYISVNSSTVSTSDSGN